MRNPWFVVASPEVRSRAFSAGLGATDILKLQRVVTQEVICDVGNGRVDAAVRRELAAVFGVDKIAQSPRFAGMATAQQFRLWQGSFSDERICQHHLVPSRRVVVDFDKDVYVHVGASYAEVGDAVLAALGAGDGGKNVQIFTCEATDEKARLGREPSYFDLAAEATVEYSCSLFLHVARNVLDLLGQVPLPKMRRPKSRVA